MLGHVYRIRNVESGRVYIGSTRNVDARRKTHWRHLRAGNHDNSHLQRAWDKYGSDFFVFEVLASLEASNQELAECENGYVVAARANEGVYNLRVVSASNAGFRWTADQRKRVSVARKGRPGKKGFRHSEETKTRQSAAALGRRISKETSQKISVANTGRKATAETKAKISKALTGKAKSAAHRAAMSKSRKGRPSVNKGRIFGPEVRAKISAAKRGQQSYTRTAATKSKQAKAASVRWEARKAAGWAPKPPIPCAHCGRPRKVLRRGQCGACSEYMRKRGVPRPLPEC